MAHFILSAIPEYEQTSLCVAAIRGTIAALDTPEGKAAIEKHKQEYLQHKAKMEKATKTIDV